MTQNDSKSAAHLTFWSVSGTWAEQNCVGYNFDYDTNPAYYNFGVGETVSFDAGFRVWASLSATQTIKETPAPTQLFTYTILDAAAALTLSVAALNTVSTLLF